MTLRGDQPAGAGVVGSDGGVGRAVAVAGMLAVADGTTFEGELLGPPATGELVFNTVLQGYQEVLTDPSYAGQVVAFTYPHLGNYGVTAADNEAARPWVRAVVARALAPRPSSWRATGDLPAFLARFGIPLLTGVDTRRLVRHVRNHGSLPVAIGPLEGPGAATPGELVARAAAEPGTTGADLVGLVTRRERLERGEGPVHLVALDLGMKESIVQALARHARCTVVPATTPAATVLAMAPDGVVLSNGPGDPAALPWLVAEVRSLLGRVPVLGICLGHQLLAEALGAATYKLRFGHHGGNHPVLDRRSGKVEITSQNHNYAVDTDSLLAAASGAVVTHENLNDGVLEGFEVPELAVTAAQYHPEAGPGPHDGAHLFADFVASLRGRH